jgi:hypothetical protein
MDKILEHDAFINAIQTKNKVKLVFFSKKDNSDQERTCAPMDYGPSRRSGSDGQNKYHFWDYDSDSKQHTLSLGSEQIKSITVLREKFDPKTDFEFDISNVEWFVPRNW